MNILFAVALLLLVASPTSAATYQEKKIRSSITKEIKGENREGIKIVRSPKPIANISASFACSAEDGCELTLTIVYDGMVDRSNHPVGLRINEIWQEIPFVAIRAKGAISGEVLSWTIAESPKELQSIDKIQVLTGYRPAVTEVFIDASKFDLYRLMTK